ILNTFISFIASIIAAYAFTYLFLNVIYSETECKENCLQNFVWFLLFAFLTGQLTFVILLISRASYSERKIYIYSIFTFTLLNFLVFLLPLIIIVLS
ncbi:MAG: hypothetical protein EDM72_01175, partial [Chlorobiota bacterium]